MQKVNPWARAAPSRKKGALTLKNGIFVILKISENKLYLVEMSQICGCG